jgi:hypothetical protein
MTEIEELKALIEKIKVGTSDSEKEFMKDLGMKPIFRTFLTNFEAKIANDLAKKGFITKGHHPKGKVQFYVDSAIFNNLFND